MASKKILVVFGATGNQGGSVIDIVLHDSLLSEQFQLRGITRDLSKASATVLSEKGVAMVKADLDDLESLELALKDAYAVFAVTNWQEVLNKEREIQQGKNIADAAKTLNVQHLIWSSLPNVSRISNGKITGVLHFDSKAVVEEYIKSIGIPATFLHLGVFMNYVLFQLIPHPTKSKSYIIKAPIPSNTRYPLVDVNADVGKYVKSILLNRGSMLGRQILGGVREYSLEEAAEILRRVGGVDVIAEQITEQEYRGILGHVGFPPFLQDDMISNMDFIEKHGFFGGEDVKRDHGILTEPLVTFEEWVAKSKEVATLK